MSLEDDSLPTLVRHALDLILRLVRDELLTLRLELVGKLKRAGVGIGLLVGGAVFAFMLMVVLLTAAVLALLGLRQMTDLVAYSVFTHLNRHAGNEFGWRWYADFLQHKDVAGSPVELKS